MLYTFAKLLLRIERPRKKMSLAGLQPQPRKYTRLLLYVYRATIVTTYLAQFRRKTA